MLIYQFFIIIEFDDMANKILKTANANYAILCLQAIIDK